MMLTWKCLSCFWIILHCLQGIVHSSTWVYEPSIGNGLSIAGRITTVDNVNLAQCIVECFMEESCITVGVSAASSSCQLYNLDLENHKHMTAQSSTSFYKSVCANQAYTYVRSLSTCIRRSAAPRTYSDARIDCQSDGGDLLMVKTNELRVYLKDIMLTITDTYSYWLGGMQTPGNNTSWSWIDGAEMTEDNGSNFWAENEPSDVTEECLQIREIYGEVLFQDQDCDNMAGFLCEITA